MSKGPRGLTLVELMVTLAVAIILLAVGLPLFSGVLSSNRLTTQTNGLVTALQLARSEAVKRRVDAFVCASTGPAAGDVDCSSSDWTNGWTVFADVDGDGSPATDELARRWDGPGAAVTLTLTGGNRVRFEPSGEINPATEVTFEIDSPGAGGETKRCVTVGITGQVRTERGGCT